MTVYLVTYDLRKQGQDYDSLIAELNRLEGHRILQSVWLVNVTNTAKELADHLFDGYMDGNDRIWVTELTRNRYFRNAMGGTNNWLDENPPSR